MFLLPKRPFYRISLVLAALALSGCATNRPASSPVQNAPATQTPTPTLTRADVMREMGAKGWQLMGTTGNTSDPNLVFIRPSTYQKVNDIARVSTFSVYGTDDARKYGNNRGASFGWELNCKARTARIVSQQVFRDALGNVQVSQRTIADAQSVPITPSTVTALVQSRICEGGPSSGTGVVIGSERVLTASHVINRCNALEAVFDGNRYPAQLMAQDTKNDLGLLAVQTLPQKRSIVLRRSANNGESVMAAGYPLSGILSRDLIVTTGIVNSLAGIGNDPTQLQISAQVSPGNSGGALIDKSGNLIGIVVSKLDVLRLAAATGDMAQNVNFAVKPEIIKMFLDANGARMNAGDASARLESEDLAARAREFTVKVECKGRPPAILGSLK